MLTIPWTKLIAYASALLYWLCTSGILLPSEQAHAMLSGLCSFLVASGIIAATHSGPNGGNKASVVGLILLLSISLMGLTACSGADQARVKQDVLTLEADAVQAIQQMCLAQPGALAALQTANAVLPDPELRANLVIAEQVVSGLGLVCARVPKPAPASMPGPATPPPAGAEPVPRPA